MPNWDSSTAPPPPPSKLHHQLLRPTDKNSNITARQPTRQSTPRRINRSTTCCVKKSYTTISSRAKEKGPHFHQSQDERIFQQHNRKKTRVLNSTTLTDLRKAVAERLAIDKESQNTNGKNTLVENGNQHD